MPPSRLRRLGSATTLMFFSVTAFATCTPDEPDEVAVQLAFPNGQLVELKMDPGVVAETTRRELNFFIDFEDATAQVTITDDPDALLEGAAEDIYARADSGAPVLFIRGQRGLSDRLILRGETWALVVGIPDSKGPEDLVDVIGLDEEDGIPMARLGDGLELPEPDRFHEPRWNVHGERGTWIIAGVQSCDGRPESRASDRAEWCDPTHRLGIEVYGEPAFVDAVVTSLKVISSTLRS